MKLSELKSIIRECLDEIEINEGINRNTRIGISRKDDPATRRAFETGVKKSIRRIVAGEKKHGGHEAFDAARRRSGDYGKSVLGNINRRKK